MAEAPSTLHLHCAVCPKKPDFSDVSHLLTHIASKGHLSHYYKLKVRAATEPAARDDIEQYDNWYADSNIESLMSERMAQKDAKRSRARSAQASAPKRPKKPRKSVKPEAAPKPWMPFEDEDPFALDEEPPFALPNPYAFVAPLIRPNRPRLFLWPTQRPGCFDSLPLEPSSSPSRSYLLRSVPFAPMFPFRASPLDDDQPTTINNEDDEAASEATRLKGTYWPGMDIFDAATPDTRRKRNQKKHFSVAESLERQSTYIEATELIFTPTGTLHKARAITGQVDLDSSPYRLDIPTPKARRRQTRAALAEKDSNAPTKLAKASSTAPFRDFGTIVDASHDIKREAEPSIKTRASRRKRDFTVFQDSDEQRLDDPMAASLLTSAYHHSPIFEDTDIAGRAVSSAFDARQAHVYQSNYFLEAFEDYQPLIGFPLYGHVHLQSATGHDMAASLPLPAEQTVDSKIKTDGRIFTASEHAVENQVDDDNSADTETEDAHCGSVSISIESDY